MRRALCLLALAALTAAASAQETRGPLRAVNVSAFFPHIPRDDFDFAGLSVDLRLGPEERPWFVDLDFRGYHASGQNVFIVNPSVGYGRRWGRWGGIAMAGIAFGGSSANKSKTGLSGTLGVSYELKRDLSAELRYVFVGPDGLGGLLAGVTFGVH